VVEVRDGQLHEWTWTPEDFGLPHGTLDTLRVDGPVQSAALIRDVIEGRARGAARDIVVANAAAALWMAGKAESLAVAAVQAQRAIDDGAAATVLRQWAEASRRGA
jgi:anthranilate phosphoribosyltransferase